MGREQFLATLGFTTRYLDLLANDRGILPEAYHVLEIPNSEKACSVYRLETRIMLLSAAR